jgi:hypothetical protein
VENLNESKVSEGEREESLRSHLLNPFIDRALEGLETDLFSLQMPSFAIEGLKSGPEVPTQDVEAIMDAGSSTEPILVDSESMHAASSTEPMFLDSEPTRVGRKRKAKNISGLTVCLCGVRAKPNEVDSIQCRKTGCETVWVH